VGHFLTGDLGHFYIGANNGIFGEDKEPSLHALAASCWRAIWEWVVH
jgi:hypothetical protein